MAWIGRIDHVRNTIISPVGLGQEEYGDKSAAMSSWEFVARIPERKRPRCFQRGLFNFLGVDLTRRGFLVCPR